MDQQPRGFASEDEEATYCLSLLRDGDRHQKIVARERLSQIFEQKGMLDEAAQCLESNIREGVRDPRIYQRLAGVYRRQGRHELADEVLVEARRLAERMTQPPRPGARRPGPGRPVPGRPAPGAPAPNPLEAPTTQLPATAAAATQPRTAEPRPGGELELEESGGLFGRPDPIADDVGPPAARPWWLAPPMLVLLVLLCGPYALAMMWVKGGYAKNARVTAMAAWAGLMILSLGAASVTLQTQLVSMIANSGALGSIPRTSAAPTPIVFPPIGGPVASPKPGGPIGSAPTPPTIAASPGALGTPPPGVTIGAAPTTPGASQPPSASATTPAGPANGSGEQVKVTGTGESGANLRERPGRTATVVKTIPDGTLLRVVGADQQMDGADWRNVRDEGGAQGWIVAELLEAAP